MQNILLLDSEDILGQIRDSIKKEVAVALLTTTTIPDLGGTDKVLTFNEARLRLRVSAPTLRRLLADSRIPSVKIGKNWRICERDLVNYLNGLRGGSQ